MALAPSAAPGSQTSRPWVDYRDMVIEQFADELADCEAALVRALQEREAYQLLAKVAIERIAEFTAKLARLQQRNRQLLEEIRGVKSRQSTEGVAA